MRLRAWLIAALALACGCATAPRFVRRTPMLRRLFFRPAVKPYLASQRYLFFYPRGWREPEPIKNGVAVAAPKGRARIGLQYFSKDELGFVPPVKFRQWLREQGEVDDSHLLDELLVSSRAAVRARFHATEYETGALLGSRSESRYSEVLMIDDPDGYFVARFDAPRDRARRYLPAFAGLLDTLMLSERVSASELESFKIPGREGNLSPEARRQKQIAEARAAAELGLVPGEHPALPAPPRRRSRFLR